MATFLYTGSRRFAEDCIAPIRPLRDARCGSLPKILLDFSFVAATIIADVFLSERRHNHDRKWLRTGRSVI